MKDRKGAKSFVPGGERIFHRIYTRLGCQGRPPRFIVEYHPYTGLTHTIRLRQDTAHVRLSDMLRGAPRFVVEAAAALLLGRLYRKQPPREMIEMYRQFSYAPVTRRRAQRLRRMRARPATQPEGRHHSLDALFDLLNARYFDGALQKPRLVWSTREWRSQLGCFDPALNQIVVNRQLDGALIPEYVVTYVLYHEMLHQKLPMKFARCRKESHSTEFRQEEKRFTEHDRAKRFLEQLSSRSHRPPD